MLRLERPELSLMMGALVGGAIALGSASCKREERGFRVNPPAVSASYLPATTDFQAGGPTTMPSIKNDYEENAYALGEGKRLYQAFNCVGCHFHGGGGIGPPLMDDQWIYGSQPEQ